MHSVLKALQVLSGGAQTQILSLWQSLCSQSLHRMHGMAPPCKSLLAAAWAPTLLKSPTDESSLRLHPVSSLNSFCLSVSVSMSHSVCLSLSFSSPPLSPFFPLLSQGLLLLSSLSWADWKKSKFSLLIMQNNPFIQQMAWGDCFVPGPVLDTGHMAVNKTDVNP